MRKFVLLLMPLAVVAALVGGCGGGGKKSVTIGDTKIQTGSLPSEFPKDFPIYSGAKFKGAISSTQQGEKGYAATWETGDSLDKVKSYYNDQFGGKSDWAQDSATDAGTGAFFTVHNKSDANKVAFVTVGGDGGTTSIVVFAGDNADDSTTTDGKATATSGSSKSTPDDADDDDSSSASTPETVPLPAEAKLPKDFPSDRVPLPAGARVTSASSYSSGGASTFIIEVYFKDSAEDVADALKTEFEKRGWKDAVTSTADGSFFMVFAGENETDAATVSIEDSDTPGYAHAALSVSITP